MLKRIRLIILIFLNLGTIDNHLVFNNIFKKLKSKNNHKEF